MGKSIYDILRKRFPEAQYSLLEEVRDKAGFAANRSADFVAIGLWPSRGLNVIGIELKCHRGDWLSELKNPEKAENIFQYCDEFYLLTGSDDIADISEIPETWGWLSIKNEKVYLKKEAPKLSPKPISRHFLAALMKRGCDKTNWVRRSEIQSEIDAAKEYGLNNGRISRDRTEKQLEELRKSVQDFKLASGIDLQHYMRWDASPTHMGEAVKIIHAGGAEPIRRDLIELEKTAQNILSQISKAVEVLKPIENNG